MKIFSFYVTSCVTVKKSGNTFEVFSSTTFFYGSIELFLNGSAKQYDVVLHVHIMGFTDSELKVVVVIQMQNTTGESDFKAHSSMLAHMLLTFMKMHFYRKSIHFGFMLCVMTPPPPISSV